MKIIFRLFSVLALFSFLLCGKNAVAQPLSPVHQGNLSLFMNDLDDYFGMSIQVPSANIQNYLNSFLPPNGSGSCTEPNAEVDEMNNQAIRFDWQPISGATNYRAGYINLYTGAHNAYITSGLSFEFSPLANGLYLFFFQSYCQGRWSRADIIIIDKVVHLEVDKDLSCKCQYGPLGQVNVEDVQNLLEYDEFDIMVMNAASIVTHKAHMKKNDLITNPITYTMNPFCGHGTLTNEGEIFYTDNGEGSFFFDMDAGSLVIDNSNYIYPIVIGLCKNAPPFNGNGTQNLITGNSNSIYPNPFSEQINISGVSESNEISTIELIDFYGNSIYQIENINDDFTLDTSEIPNGFYVLKIESGEQVHFEKMRKF